MKKKLTLLFIILLISNIIAAQPKLFQGITGGVDVSGLSSMVFGGHYKGAGVEIEANLKNRFFPVLEMGYGKYADVNEDTNASFNTKAPYFKVGLNYNTMYKKTHLPGYLYVGARYAYTTMNYDVEAPSLIDPIWPDLQIPYSYQNVNCNSSWLEFVLGIKVRLVKRIYMGWSVRYKSQLTLKKTENSEPTYIPGFGKNNNTNLGITYSLSYKLF